MRPIALTVQKGPKRGVTRLFVPHGRKIPAAGCFRRIGGWRNKLRGDVTIPSSPLSASPPPPGPPAKWIFNAVLSISVFLDVNSSKSIILFFVIFFSFSFSIFLKRFIPQRNPKNEKQHYNRDSKIHSYISFLRTIFIDMMTESRYAMIHTSNTAITEIMGLPISETKIGLLVPTSFERNSMTARKPTTGIYIKIFPLINPNR